VVPLLASDEHLQLRVLYDRSIVEVFAQEGRRVITATTYPMPDATLVRFDNAANQSLKVNVTVHAMGCAWLD
jgi:sucrose-6-phosphate hydrolase SacC (GH32 family)